MAWMRSGVRSPSAPLTTLRVAVFLLVAAAGCTKSSPTNPAKDAQREPEDVGAPSASAIRPPASASSAATGAPSGCTSDDDCRTWSSYCREAPCVCRVFAKSEAEPRCSSAGNVTCFVDPCMKKAAACQGGRCVLVIQSNP